MSAEYWIEHYYDRPSGRRVLAESVIEYPHELRTAIALAQIEYHVVFAPKGMFKWDEKRFDVIKVLLFYKGRFYKLSKNLIDSKRIYEIIK